MDQMLMAGEARIAQAQHRVTSIRHPFVLFRKCYEAETFLNAEDNPDIDSGSFSLLRAEYRRHPEDASPLVTAQRIVDRCETICAKLASIEEAADVFTSGMKNASENDSSEWNALLEALTTSLNSV